MQFSEVTKGVAKSSLFQVESVPLKQITRLALCTTLQFMSKSNLTTPIGLH